ncbi:MAG: hypothetical protein ABJA02_16470 [Acidobacteriota bacterium]
MKNKLIIAMSVGASAALFSACGGAATNNANTNVKTANATTNANANTSNANANAAANTAVAPATEGTVIKIEEAGIQMTVPKGFKFSKDGEDTIIKSEDEGVDIRFTVPKDGDYDTVVSDAAKEIDSYLDDVKVTDKGSKVDVNGMEGTSMSGTAKNKGEELSWDLTIIKAPKKPVLANIYAEKSSLEKEMKAVTEFLKSVKKI